MTPVFQTIVDPGKGNCMQAAIASLFDLKLEEVPNFVEHKEWFPVLYKFIESQGAEFDGTLYNHGKDVLPEFRVEKIKDLPGINGYFYAAVYSPKYWNKDKEECHQITHAVIVDKDLNIVHDPNLEYDGLTKYPMADELGHNGILCVYMINRK